MEWFVTPKITRLPLPGGHFIDIRDRLNVGEEQDLFAKWAPLITPGQPIQLQTRQVQTAKVLAYLLAWSFTDEHGTPVAVDEGAINSLTPEAFRLVNGAILAHETQRDAEIAEQAKNRPGATESSGTSPSVAP